MLFKTEKPLTKADLDNAINNALVGRENAILKWTIEVQLKFLAVQFGVLTAFSGLILGGVYFIVAHLVRHVPA